MGPGDDIPYQTRVEYWIKRCHQFHVTDECIPSPTAPCCLPYIYLLSTPLAKEEVDPQKKFEPCFLRLGKAHRQEFARFIMQRGHELREGPTSWLSKLLDPHLYKSAEVALCKGPQSKKVKSAWINPFVPQDIAFVTKDREIEDARMLEYRRKAAMRETMDDLFDPDNYSLEECRPSDYFESLGQVKPAQPSLRKSYGRHTPRPGEEATAAATDKR